MARTPDHESRTSGSVARAEMAPRTKKRSSFGAIASAVMLSISLVGCGIGGFGPTREVVALVKEKHIDRSSDSSHYMVITDQGGFEVDNGLLLGLWNADELYGSIKVDHSYRFVTKGRRWVNVAMQTYPYIVSATELVDQRREFPLSR
jgi:hypothetical protein